MFKLVSFRLIGAVPLLLVVCIVSFLLLHIGPGSPADIVLGDQATPERIQEVNHALGVDRPLVDQFGSWLAKIARGDLGTSLFSSQRVGSLIGDALPATLSLALVALLFATFMGVAVGVAEAVFRGSRLDRALTVGSSLTLAMPNFWLGLILVLVFAVSLKWFPTGGYTPLTEEPWLWFKGLVLPCLALGAGAAAAVSRHTRTAMVHVLGQDYVRTARAKGLPPRTVVFKHALRNAAIPVVTLTGLQFVTLLGTTLLIEQIFSIPGIGRLAINAALTKDFPVMQGIVLCTAVAVIVVNLLVDVAYGYLDPRVRPR